MATRKVQEESVQNLNDEEPRSGDYVLYWMQSSQRAEYNHALKYAVQKPKSWSNGCSWSSASPT